MAFDGRLLHSFKEKEYQSTELPKLKIFKIKEKQGSVERLVNDYEIVCKNMFKKETNIHLFSGLTVKLSTGDLGTIDGPFGQSGKFKVRLKGKLSKSLRKELMRSRFGFILSLGITLIICNFTQFLILFQMQHQTQ